MENVFDGFIAGGFRNSKNRQRRYPQLAEDEGFEPSIGFPIHAFQACALGRYANPPALKPGEPGLNWLRVAV